jgi:hypothetical protein
MDIHVGRGWLYHRPVGRQREGTRPLARFVLVLDLFFRSDDGLG